MDPECIHTPAVYVDRIFKADNNSPYSEKLIEKLTVSDHSEIKRLIKESDLLKGKVIFNDGKVSGSGKDHVRLKIVRRAAKEVRNGMNINLGIGIPTLLPSVLPEDVKIHLQSENGIMGVGPYPTSLEANANNINAGKVCIHLFRKPSPSCPEDPTSPPRSPSPSSAEDTSISPCWVHSKSPAAAISPTG